LIDLKAEPRRLLADPLADRGGVLSVAGGEDQRIEPAKRGRQRA
jgi:hypothetical protein